MAAAPAPRRAKTPARPRPRKSPRKYHVSVYFPSGEIVNYDEPKAFFSLRWFQHQVGGIITSVPVRDVRGHTLVANDDGINGGLPPNDRVAADFPKTWREFFADFGVHGAVVIAPNAVLN
jgi:hypothetical protein